MNICTQNRNRRIFRWKYCLSFGPIKIWPSYIILVFGEDERGDRKWNKNKKSFFFFFFFIPPKTSKTLSSRSGNRNSFKTTFYFRAINFFKKDKNVLKKKNPKAGRVWFFYGKNFFFTINSFDWNIWITMV